MPTMKECTQWQNLCDSGLSDMGAFCRDNSATKLVPVMRMYFHTGISDIVLFWHWVPRTMGQYVATILAILVMGIVWNGLKLLRQERDKKLAQCMQALRQGRRKKRLSTIITDKSCCQVKTHLGSEEDIRQVSHGNGFLFVH